MTMLNLFDTPLLAGLSLQSDILSPEDEVSLIAHINEADLSPFRFQQWTGKRLTHSYGWNYDFEHRRFAPADPMPAWLLPIRDRAALFAGLAPDDIVQALLIRYDPGAGIGWHKDRPVFEHVVGISLGAEAALRLRRRTGTGFERAKIALPPRSIYHLSNEARHSWEHSIAPIDAARWSITFRNLSDKIRNAEQSTNAVRR